LVFFFIAVQLFLGRSPDGAGITQAWPQDPIFSSFLGGIFYRYVAISSQKFQFSTHSKQPQGLFFQFS